MKFVGGIVKTNNVKDVDIEHIKHLGMVVVQVKERNLTKFSASKHLYVSENKQYFTCVWENI